MPFLPPKALFLMYFFWVLIVLVTLEMFSDECDDNDDVNMGARRIFPGVGNKEV